MSEKFVGKWNLLESENFDAYLKHIGIGIIQRKLATSIKPSLLIDVNESHWKMTSVSTFKTHSIEFDLGVEFTEETIDGRKMKSTCTLDDGKLTQVQKKIDAKDKDSTFVRSVDADKLIVEMDSDGIKAKRIYGKANDK
ncbi:lipocalin / cytosolic fatty-acid binding protein family domain-containing protein [Ditylenchus destructor]|uniref:Lipocalin / cytosolic fatty-acid binding protein family domain-containing protein n=1 Tax=Ditylenchus destructor TaxID=166010 RepID=A0AAD4R6V2_9BILA|nr:lipocalin / cytosolic fatty-acid binding protein family domain-containing protein [Ditylenchus destructor]